MGAAPSPLQVSLLSETPAETSEGLVRLWRGRRAAACSLIADPVGGLVQSGRCQRTRMSDSRTEKMPANFRNWPKPVSTNHCVFQTRLSTIAFFKHFKMAGMAVIDSDRLESPEQFWPPENRAF